MKPSSQLNMMLFGKVVTNPTDDPFWGTASGPQSLAKDSEKAITQLIEKRLFCISFSVEVEFLVTAIHGILPTCTCIF